MKISSTTRDWLLAASEPYIRYNAKDFFDLETDRAELLHDPFVKENLALLKNWRKEVLTNHSRAQIAIHRLTLLADLGLKADDKPLRPLMQMILEDFSEDNIPQVLIELPKVFGGSGAPEKAWMICDFTVILAALLKMGVKNKKVELGVRRLENLVSENGFRCLASIPNFRGPGRKDDFCPYVNILAAKALSGDPAAAKSQAAALACEALLLHWQARGEKKYFLFGVGTEYKKIKFPFVWYNILHTVDVLSRYKHVHKDKRFLEMLEIISGKGGADLRFKPESVYLIYKNQDFGNKKEYSRIITLAVHKILRRVGRLS
jgi:hypothetical protein